MQESYRKCHQAVAQTIRFFEKVYDRNIPIPDISFGLKGPTAGYCSNKGITLNADFLEEEGDTFIQRTPPHEAVHWVELFLFNRTDHGPRWKNMMRMIGRDDSQFHTYKSTDRVCVKAGYKPYKCQCTTHLISPARIKDISKQGYELYCKKCNTKLEAKIWLI